MTPFAFKVSSGNDGRLSGKSFWFSKEHNLVFFGDVVEACCQMLLCLFYVGCCGYVELIVFELDKLRVFHGVLNSLMA